MADHLRFRWCGQNFAWSGDQHHFAAEDESIHRRSGTVLPEGLLWSAKLKIRRCIESEWRTGNTPQEALDNALAWIRDCLDEMPKVES